MSCSRSGGTWLMGPGVIAGGASVTCLTMSIDGVSASKVGRPVTSS